MDNGVGYYTKELENGKIELFIGIGDGVLLPEGVFGSMDEVDDYIEQETDR
jgi:hypothetical protein